MGNIIGNKIKFILSGESHGDYIVATLDNFPAGIKIDYEYINLLLKERRPMGISETKRIEDDNIKIVSGVFNSITTGAPITILIENKNIKSIDYENLKKIPRPSHADYVAKIKYKDCNDYRGGGHFSGRLTVGIVVIGAICELALRQYNIKISSHIKSVGNIVDRSFDIVNFSNLDRDIKILEKKRFKVLDDIEDNIINEIEKIAKDGDSIGGIIETVVNGIKVGLGEPMFNSVESEIAKAMFSIPAIKGIEFGLGFKFSESKGSEVNDMFYIDDDKIYTKTNNNAGINGGITNGMPICFRVVVKPTPSIEKEMLTLNLETKKEEKLKIIGRHDPFIARRANVVVRAFTSFVIFDLLSMNS